MKQPVEFGDYYLFERIAVGGMAEVFKAASYGVEGFERVVALKRVLPQISEDQAFIDMFVDEAKIAVQLDHPNISRIYDLGNAEDSYYIAMEYVSGHDARALFDRLIKQGKTLSIAMCCHLVKEVCEALEYAHSKTNSVGEPLSLIHRDVSPQNILIGYDGQVKLIDFGIAKAAGKATKTRSGILKGKFGYMSPEHVRGRPIDKRSDLFALAVVLYELLTLERCFRGKDDFSTLEKVRRVDFRSVRELNRSVPPELERIIVKGLAKSPKARFQSAAEFQDALQTFLYQIGSFVSRKKLSEVMTDLFAEEKEGERIALNTFRHYARQHIPAARRASSLDDLIAGSAVKMAPTTKLLPEGQAPPAPPLSAPHPQQAQVSVSDKPTEEMSGPPSSIAPFDRPTLKSEMAPNEVSPQPMHTVQNPNQDRRGLLLAALAVVALIGAFFLALRSQQMEPGRIQITTVPKTVEVFVDKLKTYTGVTPITLNNIAPNQPYTVVIKSQGYDPQERRLSLKPGENRSLRIILTPKAGRTKLNLNSIPSGAVVKIDGRSVGKTPIENLAVQSGKRTITYIIDGIAVKTESTVISLGETQTKEVTLPPPQIDVRLKIEPRVQSTILIRDSKGIIKTYRTLPDRIQVPNDGTHELVVKAQGYEQEIVTLKSESNPLSLGIKLTPFQSTLTKTSSRPQNKRRAKKRLRPRRLNQARAKPQPNAEKNSTPETGFGFLSIHSFPTAECFIDGNPVGTTPVYREKISAGAHAIMLKRDGEPNFQHIARVRVQVDKEKKYVYRHPK